MRIGEVMKSMILFSPCSYYISDGLLGVLGLKPKSSDPVPRVGGGAAFSRLQSRSKG